MAGHVFVTHGDLTAIACDAWLLPTDSGLHITPTWWGTASRQWRERIDTNGFLEAVELPDGWGRDVRATVADGWVEDGPLTVLTDVGGTPATPPEWFAAGAAEFVATAAEALRARDRSPAHKRAIHLLAMPVVGSGKGGSAAELGPLIAALLPAVQAAARASSVDVVLVTFSDVDHAAAQHLRRASEWSWSELDDDLEVVAVDLATQARHGDLVLFLGAGVSAGAGLPLWGELVQQIAREAGVDVAELDELDQLDVVDQAQLLGRRLEAQGRRLNDVVAGLVRARRHGLAHSLLASLPVREVVTLNYDTLFEEASRAAGRPVTIVPEELPAPDARWLLKLHGSADSPDDIVLTRPDFIRYSARRSALAGVVQALLMTRHMLFVGFSLSDDNFHRIADEVRRAVGEPRLGDSSTLGTALLLEDQPLLEELWSDTLRFAATGRGADSTEADAARRLEILLDRLLCEATVGRLHLLDERYESLLDEDERQVAGLLRELVDGSTPALRASEAWVPVQRLLESLGL